MKTYTVQIQAVEYYTINVNAKDEDDAEEKAWRLFPHMSPMYGENNVTDVACQDDSKPHDSNPV